MPGIAASACQIQCNTSLLNTSAPHKSCADGWSNRYTNKKSSENLTWMHRGRGRPRHREQSSMKHELLLFIFIHSFIHSFILNIYIAPLQEDYSEALPTPARLKRAVYTSTT